jgi:hypothetical protein
MPQHLDRRDELVEVHVQHPPGHAQVLPGERPVTNPRGRPSTFHACRTAFVGNVPASPCANFSFAQEYRVMYFPQRDKRRMIRGIRTGFIVDGIGRAEFTDH